MGFGGVAAGFPGALGLVKYAGGGYVLYLAWRLWRAAGAVEGVEPRRAGFIDGAVLLLLNPKAYLIISAVFTQFIAAGDGAQLALIVWITTVFTLNNWVAFSLWTLAGDRLLRGFRSEARAKKLNAAFALTLAAVAVWMMAQ